jgi:expansin (peptidoglycan-binding protein)
VRNKTKLTTCLQQIVDKCPECDAGHLDLFQNAWSALEPDTSKGIIDTSYEFVDCGSAVSGPLTIHLKSGVSPYWFSAQVVNANRRTAKLEVSTDGKTWKAAKRTDYNFFEIPSGVGAAKASVRVTSGDGKSVVVKDVAMTPDLSVKGPSNYQ